VIGGEDMKAHIPRTATRTCIKCPVAAARVRHADGEFRRPAREDAEYETISHRPMLGIDKPRGDDPRQNRDL